MDVDADVDVEVDGFGGGGDNGDNEDAGDRGGCEESDISVVLFFSCRQEGGGVEEADDMNSLS